MPLIKKVLLECVNGSSNKFYEVRMLEEDGIYAIEGRYGSRTIVDYRERGGSTHEKGTTVHRPLAERWFDNLAASKIDKGYTEVHRYERQEIHQEEEEEPCKSPSLTRFSMLDI